MLQMLSVDYENDAAHLDQNIFEFTERLQI